jgi:hypothetical protein
MQIRKVAQLMFSAAFSIGASIFVRPADAQPHQGRRVLFRCEASRLYTLGPGPASDPDQPFSVIGHEKVQEQVTLLLEPISHSMTLIRRSKLHPTRKYSLENVEQGNPSDSGVSGKLYTVIRAKIPNGVVTIFAGYDNFGEAGRDGEILFTDQVNRLLTCDDDFRSPEVTLPGRRRSTDIFGLAQDGFAQRISHVPVEPDTEEIRRRD